MANADSRKALGRGLSTLLPTNRPTATSSTSAIPKTSSAPLRVPITAIDPNPLQPRTVFQADRLQELAQSIHEHGIIQPLIVRSPARATNWSPGSAVGVQPSLPASWRFPSSSRITRMTVSWRSPSSRTSSARI